jgi:hypothetical protein
VYILDIAETTPLYMKAYHLRNSSLAMLFLQYEASADETNAREEIRKSIAEQLNQRVATIQGGAGRA